MKTKGLNLISALLGIILLLTRIRCDNHHTTGRKAVVCNGSVVDRPCLGSRWKISYLGSDELVISETEEKVTISGLIKIEKKETVTETGVHNPEGYNIILHYDNLYRTVPEKVMIMTGGVFATVLGTVFLFSRLERLFGKVETENPARKYL